MPIFKKLTPYILIVFASMFSFSAIAQHKQNKKNRKREFYFSWGYNKEWYTHSNLHISQPGLGNNYTLQSVNAHDHPGWNEQFFTKAISIPQYNYRIGYIFNKKRNLGVEINFDHTKYIVADEQMIHLVGTLNGNPWNGYKLFQQDGPAGYDSSSYYFLNNGANFLLFNIVKRWHLIANKKATIIIDGLGKFGIGPVIPHVQNSFFGKANNPGFQFGGWNTGLEAALRVTCFKYIYLEYTNKLDYARYSGLHIYGGTARQAFGTYEMILNLGLSFPMGKRG